MDAGAARNRGLGVAGVVLVALAVLGVGAGWALQLFYVPRAAAMLQDFGTTLPRITRMAVVPVVSLGLTTVAALAGGTGVALRALRGGRAGLVLLALAALAALAIAPLLVYAIYLPVFEVAGAVR